MNLKSELKRNSALLVSVSSESYSKATINITRQLVGLSIRYVTLNKTKDAVEATLKESGVSTKGMCFIDGISNTAIKKTKNTSLCFYLNSPNDLKSLDKYISNDKQEVIIFDSLSTLLIYESLGSVVKFVKELVRNMKPRKIVFIALEGDKEKLLAEKLSKSVKVVKLT